MNDSEDSQHPEDLEQRDGNKYYASQVRDKCSVKKTQSNRDSQPIRDRQRHIDRDRDSETKTEAYRQTHRHTETERKRKREETETKYYASQVRDICSVKKSQIETHSEIKTDRETVN